MEKSDLAKFFSVRLHEAMIAAGFQSQRSPTGVCINKLAEITGHSVQICRKYLRGETIPEPVKLVEIAEKLNVSPGWLLFGNSSIPKPIADNLVINKKLLQHIFIKATSLYNSKLNHHEVSDFLIELVSDISLINATEKQSTRIIDLAISSATHFKK